MPRVRERLIHRKALAASEFNARKENRIGIVVALRTYSQRRPGCAVHVGNICRIIMMIVLAMMMAMVSMAVIARMAVVVRMSSKRQMEMRARSVPRGLRKAVRVPRAGCLHQQHAR